MIGSREGIGMPHRDLDVDLALRRQPVVDLVTGGEAALHRKTISCLLDSMMPIGRRFGHGRAKSERIEMIQSLGWHSHVMTSDG